ncbi:hypothetical protein FAF44_00700 [Nonomuraea sp. MG754425]|uniref:hypothetical protein n=1 Tax=Nonomuraea sp. MG754425 TaxID=2570319 RepID=UPI001F42E4E0|nr:hypothetical protein [Nonomuraea sp. MG754425]MCF6466934.1 hypothetical protein [Nonomuraea sp. MG754425]
MAANTPRAKIRRTAITIALIASAAFTATIVIGTLGPLATGTSVDQMEWNIVWPWAISCTALLSISIWARRRETRARLAQVREDPGETLNRRVRLINGAFSDAAKLMEDLRRDLEAQQAVRELLIAQAEEQQRLLGVNEDQAEKIRQILIGQSEATVRAERRQQWMFFTLGLVASIPIGIMINLLVP